jgi:hypothetical protein
MIIITVNFTTLPLTRQFFLIPDRLNEFVDQSVMFDFLLESVLPEFITLRFILFKLMQYIRGLSAVISTVTAKYDAV